MPAKTGNMIPGLVSHIGVAVADLDQAIARYRLITGSEPVVHDVPDQKVRVAMFSRGDNANGSRIELVAATEESSPIARYLAKHGEGLHHICIYVADLEAKLTELEDAGMQLIDRRPRIGADGHRIAFVHPAGANGVLLELEEMTS
ncbi:MAG: methylmalonyl-CoA epimerase [bacterium]